MIPLSKILLPVDFSERCLGAAHYAASLASRFLSEIALVHVVEPLRYDFGEMEFAGGVANEVMQGRVAQARQRLDTFLAPELAGASVSRVLLEGDPARCIVGFAHDQQAGLIAMPTHGYGPFRRFILGSVTAKVLHDADCPVWTGGHMEQRPADPGTLAPEASERPIRNVLCGVDLGPQSEKTLDWAAMLAREFGARLTVLHAVGSALARDRSRSTLSSSSARAAVWVAMMQKLWVRRNSVMDSVEKPG